VTAIKISYSLLQSTPAQQNTTDGKYRIFYFLAIHPLWTNGVKNKHWKEPNAYVQIYSRSR
jgi:hypothetical protein